MDYPRILVVSRAVWDDTNSFGNTHSNMFAGWDPDRIANIYCDNGLPNTSVCNRFFQINERMLIANLLHSSSFPGQEIITNPEDTKEPRAAGSTKLKVFDFARTHRLQMFFLLRDAIWRLGRWQSPELKQFIVEFDPEIVYIPIYPQLYINQVEQWVIRTADKPYYCFIGDDDYSLRQFSLSPLYWIDRLAVRQKLRQIVKKCSILYCISDRLKEECEKDFHRECRLLYKAADFVDAEFSEKSVGKPVRIVYTGNIYSGRWKSLARIGQALKNINKHQVNAQLFIYTQSSLSNRIHKALDIQDCVFLMGGVSSSEVKKVLLEADIVVHVESFELRDRLATRLSFSTKLVDYFKSARCIFAVGWNEAASIEYLVRNDAAIVATSPDDIEGQLRKLIENPHLIHDYGLKAWDCGQRNHQMDDVKQSFWADLITLCDNGSSEPSSLERRLISTSDRD